MAALIGLIAFMAVKRFTGKIDISFTTVGNK